MGDNQGMNTGQDLQQGRFYYSASHNEQLEIKTLPVPHAERALHKLLREYGESCVDTPLAHALYERVRQGEDATTTEVSTIDGSARMLRGKHGRFTGSYRPSPSKKGKRPVR